MERFDAVEAAGDAGDAGGRQHNGKRISTVGVHPTPVVPERAAWPFGQQHVVDRRKPEHGGVDRPDCKDVQRRLDVAVVYGKRKLEAPRWRIGLKMIQTRPVESHSGPSRQNLQGFRLKSAKLLQVQTITTAP